MAHEFGFRPTEWGEDRPHRSNGEHPVVFEVRPEVPVAELLRQPDSLPTAPLLVDHHESDLGPGMHIDPVIACSKDSRMSQGGGSPTLGPSTHPTGEEKVLRWDLTS